MMTTPTQSESTGHGPETYRKIFGRMWLNFGLIHSGGEELWVAPDHLLVLRTGRFTERHRRFPFKDVQAITVCATTEGGRLSLALVLCAVISGAIILCIGYLMANGLTATGGTVAGLFAGFFVVFALLNAALGPTCICRIHTAVQVERLGAFRRLRRARRFLNLVTPLCEEAQGRLDPEALAGLETLDGIGASRHVHAQTEPPEATRREKGRVHAALFALLVFDAAVSLLVPAFFITGVGNSIGVLLFLAVACVNVAALIKQHGSDLSTAIRSMTWVLAALTLVGLFVGMILGAFVGIDTGFDEEALTLWASDPSGPLMRFNQVASAIELILGLAGLALLFQFLSSRRDRGAVEAQGTPAEE